MKRIARIALRIFQTLIVLTALIFLLSSVHRYITIVQRQSTVQTGGAALGGTNPAIWEMRRYCDSQNLDFISVTAFTESVVPGRDTWKVDKDGKVREEDYYNAICMAALQIGRRLSTWEVEQISWDFVNPGIELWGNIKRGWFLWIPAMLCLYSLIVGIKRGNLFGER